MRSRKSSAAEGTTSRASGRTAVTPAGSTGGKRGQSGQSSQSGITQLALDWHTGFVGLLAGVDEAGRGPLAGPVVAAAVILDDEQPIAGLADSKVLVQQTGASNVTKNIGNTNTASVGDAAFADVLRAAKAPVVVETPTDGQADDITWVRERLA